jgi:hypothetical protein
MPLPALVMHADWGVHPRKRWQAAAVLQADRRYRLLPTARVGPLDGFWRSLEASEGRVLLGFDFPLGLPAAYASRAGINDFAQALPRFASPFYNVADRTEEISLARPFYPARPGGCRRQHLLDGLGLKRWECLLRQCDRRTPARNAACALSGRSAAARSARPRSPAGAICWRRRCAMASTSASGRSRAASRS